MCIPMVTHPNAPAAAAAVTAGERSPGQPCHGRALTKDNNSHDEFISCVVSAHIVGDSRHHPSLEDTEEHTDDDETPCEET